MIYTIRIQFNDRWLSFQDDDWLSAIQYADMYAHCFPGCLTAQVCSDMSVLYETGVCAGL